MLEADLAAYILLDVYPDFDCHSAKKATQAFERAFVVSLNSFESNTVMQYADVLLPMASVYETSGTQININGERQSFVASVSAPMQSKPAWKILKVLADLLNLPGFHYADSMQVFSELLHHHQPEHLHQSVFDLSLSTEICVVYQRAPYCVDVLLRHAAALQQSEIGQLNHAYMAKKTAETLTLDAGDDYQNAQVVIDTSIAENCIFVYGKNPRGEI
jgi:NADH-quinone oxidoreductase subunit G